MAYVLRFCNNLKKNRIDPKKGKLEVAELYEAEKVILKEIQLETLAEEKQIKLNTMKGDDGLIRVETRVSLEIQPSSAPWWGGFWERLVGMLKNVLRKVLGKASLNEEELNTLLCDAESIINSIPITYLSEDPKDLVALTPAMFLQEIREIGVPDFDMIDSKKLDYLFTE
ncbi:pro-Pol polyprotein [Trichonephila clavipes]|nr:pro-Pol polyprotein [Trichonephila clavipes]